MPKNPLIRVAIALVALAVLAGGGFWLFLQITGGSGEASQEISAPTLARRTAVPTEVSAVTTVEATEEATPVPPTRTPRPTEVSAVTTTEATEPATPRPPTRTPIPTATPVPATRTPIPTSTPAPSNDLLFRIVPEESEVRFKIDEDLRGRRVTVVGATNQVAGDILIDRVNPPNSQIGTIRINVRTLQTDSGNRDRAIRSFILESARDEYEFSDFVPTAIENMPTSVEVGTPFEFLVIGDLTLRGQTRQVTFNVTVTPISEERIEGQARAQVLYKDFGLSIPEVPGVANISDEVKLEIDFVAVLVAE